MAQDSFEKRNFLFFLNEAHPLDNGDALIGALAGPSSWDEVASMVKTARQKDAFARTIKRLQLYVYVPFCGKICTFCRYDKILLRQRPEIDVYIKNLARQMIHQAPVYKGMDAVSVSFGGGTPSILNEKQWTVILDTIDQEFPASGRKILLEAHPSSWTASKLALLSSRGLYRLSIGIQSLDDKVLKQVSRSQTRKKVLWCLRSARKAGIPHVNVDFIAGLPGQTVQGLSKDLLIVIDEGVNSISVEPYHTLSFKEMCGPGESIPAFFKKRDAMMRAAVQILTEAGFRCKGLFGIYTRNGGPDENRYEETYSRLEEAVAAFGPFARGQFPGTVLYRAGASKSSSDFPAVKACAQDIKYVMTHYAVFALMGKLDEKDFLKRFGVSLDKHCGEGLRYLQQAGLLAYTKGIWKFSGKWEIRRLREFVSLSRALFGQDVLVQLRTHYLNQYNPRHDYSGGNSLLKAYADDFLMNLYYRGETY